MFLHRPLALALALLLVIFGVVAALSCSALSLFAIGIILCGILLLGLVLMILSVVGLRRKRVDDARRARYLSLLLLFFVLVFALVRSSTSLLRYRTLRSLEGKEGVATFIVRETEVTSGGFARYRVLLKTFTSDGEVLEVDASVALILEMPHEYEYGDCLAGEVLLLPVVEAYPDTTYALADGILLAMEPLEDDAISITSTSSQDFIGEFLRLSRTCRATLSYALSESIGGSAGKLASAMLLGDRDALPEDVTRDFGLAGLSHLLAVSGLHLSVLVGMLSALLFALGFPKRLVAALSIPMTLIILVLTGCSMSACRASVMLIAFAFLQMFYRKGDGLTILFAAPSTVLVCFPYAVFSIGLWMSFAAVLALMIFTSMWNTVAERFKTPKHQILHWVMKLLCYVLSLLCASVIANLAVFPLLYLSDMDFSLASVLSSLLTVPLMPMLLALSVLVLIFRPIAVFGVLLSRIAAGVADWMLFVARKLGEIRFVSVSTAHEIFHITVWIMAIPTLVLLCVLPVMRGKRQGGKRCEGYLLIAPILAILLSVTGIVAENRAFLHREGAPMAYSSVKSGEVLVYRLSDGSGVLFDLSEGRYNAYREAVQIARELCITEWTALVLTHYHTAQISSVTRFCRNYAVRMVYLPEVQAEAEQARLMSIRDRLDHLGACYRMYAREETVMAGEGMTFFLSKAEYLDRSVQPIFFLELSGGDKTVGYLSSSVYESDLWYRLSSRIAACTDLIFGFDGPSVHQSRLVETEKLSAKSILLCGEDNTERLKIFASAENANGEAVTVVKGEQRRFYRSMGLLTSK